MPSRFGLIYRLSVSLYRDRFVLKGGMLVKAWVRHGLGSDPFDPRDNIMMGAA